MAEKGYAGKISNTGAQKVQAPHTPNTTKGKSDVKRGDDLRTKK